jgi:HAD superfamily phosphoserine phosphatase-like hydrolase
MKTFAIFDFDKTIISKDSFRIFSFLAAKNLFEKTFILYYTLLCHFSFITNKEYKKYLLEKLWSGLSVKDKNRLNQMLFEKLTALLNIKIISSLKKHLENGDNVVVLSASPEFYLVPFIYNIDDKIRVFGSRVTQRIDGVDIQNLYKQKKADVAKEIISECPTIKNVIVYTDHIDDYPLIKLASKVVLVKPKKTLVKYVSDLNIPFEKFI